MSQKHSQVLIRTKSLLSHIPCCCSRSQEGQVAAEEEEVSGGIAGQHGHPAGEPSADGRHDRVHSDRGEGGGGTETRERGPQSATQGTVIPVCT